MRILTDKILNNNLGWYYTRKLLDLLIGSYRLRRPLIKKYGIKGSESVLDVGCGTGELSTLVKGNYLGIDLEQNYIDLAKEKYATKTHKFIRKDLNKLKASEKKYDIGLLIDLTHHIEDKELITLLKKLDKLITKDIVICDPIKQKDSNYLGKFMTSLDRGTFIRPKNKLISIVKKTLGSKKSYTIRNLKIGPIETICIFVHAKKQK